MDDPKSITALIAFVAAFLVAWAFARVERLLAMRSQSTFERLIDQVEPWGGAFVADATRKRHITLGASLGRVIATALAVVFVFVRANQIAATGALYAVGAYAVATIISLVPLFYVNIVVTNSASEEIGTRALKSLLPPLIIWSMLLWPIVWVLDGILERAPRPEEKEAREEAFRAFVEEETEDGVIEEEKREMINSIIKIDETEVREVMVPRVDMVAVDYTTTLKELVAIFGETRHSRIPVYADRVDNIIGIVHAKDALDTLVDGSIDPASVTLDRIMRGKSALLFVPTTNKIDDLLRVLRYEKKHMAFAVDEYGGVAGLVTMEDILEEIVGEIQDEYDEEEEFPYTWVNDHQVVVDASMDIADVNELLDMDLPDENGYETLGGFLYHRFSAVPERGARTVFGEFELVVASVDAQRINKVMIEKIDIDDEEADERTYGNGNGK